MSHIQTQPRKLASQVMAAYLEHTIIVGVTHKQDLRPGHRRGHITHIVLCETIRATDAESARVD